jgi:hypothetical protein
MKTDLNPFCTVRDAFLALLFMLIAWTPVLALEAQEGGSVETSVSEEDLADSEEKVDTNDPTAAAWSYALGFEFKELGIADNTIVIFSTDNGAEKFTFPDGGASPYHGEKGTTWEGGMRVPQMVKWPGTIKPGTIINDTMSHEDWMPTLLAAAGVPDVKEKLASKDGYKANGKTFKVHLDGYNFKPYFEGKEKKAHAERSCILQQAVCLTRYA